MRFYSDSLSSSTSFIPETTLSPVHFYVIAVNSTKGHLMEHLLAIVAKMMINKISVTHKMIWYLLFV